MADSMPVYPDPEQSPKGSSEGDLRELRAILDTIKIEVSLLVLDRDAYRRERNIAMQALAEEVCHGGDGPTTIRMDPQKGLQGWCRDCECWHCWVDWCSAGWNENRGWTEDRDSPGGSPP